MSNVLDPKDPDVSSTYEIDWLEELIVDPLRSTDFSVGDFVRAQRDTGWYYECTTAGRTARQYPEAWPREAGVIVADGSLIWTCRHPADSAVPVVSAATWTVPSGLILVSQVEAGTVTQITVSGGTDGVDYSLTCRMTPSVGLAIEQTIVIPVASQ